MTTTSRQRVTIVKMMRCFGLAYTQAYLIWYNQAANAMKIASVGLWWRYLKGVLITIYKNFINNNVINKF